MLDGLYDNNIFSGMPIVGGSTSGGGIDQSTILPIDAIQEINVIENPKAEYGWRPGAQVNVGLKSGTNSIHGTRSRLVAILRLDARNYFLPIQRCQKRRSISSSLARALVGRSRRTNYSTLEPMRGSESWQGHHPSFKSRQRQPEPPRLTASPMRSPILSPMV